LGTLMRSAYRLNVTLFDGSIIAMDPGGALEIDLVSMLAEEITRAMNQTLDRLVQDIAAEPVGLFHTRAQVQAVLMALCERERICVPSAVQSAVANAILDLKKRVPPLAPRY
jgi:hypothetical protein